MDFKKFSQLIMMEQTLFALPFAYIGVLFAGGKTVSVWIWVTIALAFARIAGMSFNRVIDAKIDAKNERTKERLVPKGEVSKGVVWVIGVVSLLVLVLASYMLNMLCFYLSFPACFLLFTYSYFKRFTSTSHFYLGLVEAAAPIGGYLAVAGAFSLIPFLLGLAILMWIAGLDIVYAMQDEDFDVKEGLYSVPAKYGEKKALIISAFCYVISIFALVYAGLLTGKGLFYWAALIFIGLIFVLQQKFARQKDIEVSIKKFFKINMYVSPILFLGTFLDVISN